jgi:hypothetical protein
MYQSTMTLKGTPSAHARMYRISSTSAVVQEQNPDHAMKAPAERLSFSVVLGALMQFKTRAPEVHDQRSRPHRSCRVGAIDSPVVYPGARVAAAWH